MGSQERQPSPNRARVRSLDDLAERVPPLDALKLVVVESAGLGVLFTIFAVLDAVDSALAPLLVPPAVSFVLIVANSAVPGSRPLRVVGAYLIAGVVGLGFSALPGPTLVEAVVACALALLLMHLTGALHSPAIAVTMIAVLADFSAPAAAASLPLLLGLSVLVVVLAWVAHALLGDAAYPTAWY